MLTLGAGPRGRGAGVGPASGAGAAGGCGEGARPEHGGGAGPTTGGAHTPAIFIFTVAADVISQALMGLNFTLNHPHCPHR